MTASRSVVFVPYKKFVFVRGRSFRSALESSSPVARNIPLKELENFPADFGPMSFQRKMAGIEEMDFRLGIVPRERLRARRQEERIIPAPNRQQRRTLLAEILLELRIQRHVACVIQEEVKLYLLITRPCQQRRIERVRLR